MTLADELERILAEHGPRSACWLAADVGRRKTDVLAALRDPRFGDRQGPSVPWKVGPPRSMDADEAADRWGCRPRPPRDHLRRGGVPRARAGRDLNGNGRVFVTAHGLETSETWRGGRVSERLPELLDAKALRLELGVTRAAAEAIMRQLPVVQIEGLRKVYVRRADVAAYLEARTFTKSEVPS